MNKIVLITFMGSMLFGVQLFSQSLEVRLLQLGFDSIRPFEINHQGYTEAWELFIQQPLDHAEPNGRQFNQRFFLRHRGYDKPMVLITEGYAANYGLQSRMDHELARRLDANLLIAEHRFFGQSMPDTLIWEHLNMKNVSTDLHRITTAMKQVYDGPWLSTGISKGGQTSIYYRYFYPDDVQASVPYVAPLNFSDEDERVYHFLDTVSTAECRQRIFDIQYRLLSDQDVFRPMFTDSAAARNLTFDMVGGIEKAFEYNVLEFSFAYWQWYPVDCDLLPPADADIATIYNTFISAAGYDFFADQGIDGYQPFFYQALTEMGMYNYQTSGFEDVMKYVKDPGFQHTLPEGIVVKYDPQLNLEVDQWLRAEGNNMVYIYGGYDAWSATAVHPGNHTNALKLLLPGGSHRVRLRHFPAEVQEMTINLLRSWLQNNTDEVIEIKNES